MRIRTLAKLLPLCLAIPVLMAALALAQKGNPNKVKKLIHLAATGSETSASGIAKIMFKTKGNAIQRFQVVGTNLHAGTAYALFVNGNLIATKTAASEQGDGDPSVGAVEFIYSTDAQGHSEDGSQPLPPALNPVTNITLVELRTAAGMVVLTGTFS